MNAVENFATGIITTKALGAEQIATITADSQDFPGIAITTSWDRKVLDTPLASIIGNVSTEQAGLPAEEVDQYVKKVTPLMTGLERLISKRNMKRFSKGNAVKRNSSG